MAAEKAKPAEGLRGTKEADRIRARVAWMYFVEQLTQSEIAKILDIGRVTVVRLLADARARGEVNISIKAPLIDVVALERKLETHYGLQQAVVTPLSTPNIDPIPVIAAAVGEYIMQLAQKNVRMGVGWGRTLSEALNHIQSQPVEGIKIYSLLGGIIQAKRFNPSEFAWRLAEAFNGEGFLIPAPAIVNSGQTKRTLIEECGLEPVLDLGEGLDVAILSAGGIDDNATSSQVGYLSKEERASVVEAGAIGDLLFHFFNKDGQLIEHEIHQRIMSVQIERVKQAKTRVLASGGKDKVKALGAAIKLYEPTVFITDEVTAAAMVKALG
ncbi:sugar-binding transcriptional regulator [Rhodobacteraceae bacterium RKSG542]|uniref:sugar-binding transcriptional regulator n=1 Tax=Pseudovibrio flavus TaxID=2529854 RepID=UPI0012BC0A0D|nr:sugar-binding transcriptional regulator [Pseudovibrio flavus]MTI16002.1 sugar-binding transcriptional regulator [Pseudovibrio flavus]